MDIQTLTSFFMWCTIINGVFYTLWAVFCVFAPDFLYRVQSMWFDLPRESYNIAIYAFLGVFKIFFIIFNITPLIALLVIGG